MYDNLPAAACWRATNCAPMPRFKVAFCWASELESVNLDLSPFPVAPLAAQETAKSPPIGLMNAYNYLGSVNPVVIKMKNPPCFRFACVEDVLDKQ